MSCIRFYSIQDSILTMRKKLLPRATFFLCFISFMLAADIRGVCGGGPGPQFELDQKDLEKLKSSPKKSTSKGKKETSSKPALKGGEPARPLSNAATYTVKPGDNLFKILMRDFGLSNREAELRIPEVVRINDLPSSTNLTVGKKLLIPAERQAKATSLNRSHGEMKRATRQLAPLEKPEAIEAAPPAAVPQPAEPTPATTGLTVLTVKSVSGSNSDQTLDLLLTALSIPWSKDRVINGSSGSGSPESFSIKVERYLELDGKRFVLARSSNNPYEYTFLRLLEMAGYSIIRLDDRAGFPVLASQLLSKLGFTFSSGKHRFSLPDKAAEPRIIDGFLVSLKGPQSKVFITETPLDAVSAETLASSSVEPYKGDGSVSAPAK